MELKMENQLLDERLFLCDQMLTRLGRWLRAAGYDTRMVEEPITDRSLLLLAQKEKRWLISRDRHFLKMQGDKVIWLEANDLQACVCELTMKHHIDWLKAPLSRCLLCNQLLVSADESSLLLVPERILKRDCIRYCSHCGKVYWEGSHAKRIMATLERWKTISLR